MTIQLTRAQMKMLSPKARKEVAFENKWRTNHSISLFVREDKDEEWCLLRTLTWGSEREHDKCRLAMERALQGWSQNYFRIAQFKIVDGGEGN